jgi:NAD(P)H-hydrate epimerase
MAQAPSHPEPAPAADRPLVFSPAGVRALDAVAARELGLTEPDLIARAAAALLLPALALIDQLAHSTPTHHPVRAIILAGKGNNGADGHALAPLLLERHHRTHVLSATDAVAPLDALRALAPVPASTRPQATAPQQPTLIVDCLLGVGLDRPVTGPLAQLIAHVNALRAASPSVRVLACDSPSGLHAGTGQPMAVLDPPVHESTIDGAAAGVLASAPVPFAIAADVTLTFMGLKRGMLAPGAQRWCGRIDVGDLGLPPAFVRAFAEP